LINTAAVGVLHRQHYWICQVCAAAFIKIV